MGGLIPRMDSWVLNTSYLDVIALVVVGWWRYDRNQWKIRKVVIVKKSMIDWLIDLLEKTFG